MGPRDEFSLPLRKRGLECLHRLPCFRDCKEMFLEKIVAGLAPKFVGPNELIAEEGEEARELLLLRRGAAQAITSEADTIEDYSDGDTIGNPTLLFARFAWPFSVRTSDCCEIQALPAKEFRVAISLHPEEGHRIAKALGIASGPTGMRRCIHQPDTLFAAPHVRRSISFHSAAPHGAAALSGRLRRADIAGQLRGKQLETSRRKAIFAAGHFGGTGALSDPNEASPGLSGMPVPGARVVLGKLKSALADKFTKPDSEMEQGAQAEGKDLHQPPESVSHKRSTLKTLGQSRRSTVKSRSPVPTARTSIMAAEESPECNHTSFQMWAYAAQENDEASLRELAGWLDSIPFFNSMDAFCFERLLTIVEKKVHKKGEAILRQGTVPEALYVIYAGKADVVADDSIVASVGPKSVLGERSICRTCASGGEEPAFCSASIVVTSTVLVTIALPREKLLEVFRKDYCVARQFEELFDQQRRERGEIGLSNTMVFQDAEPSFAEQIENSSKLLIYPKGSTIMTKGQAASEAFLICKGTVKIVRGKGDLRMRIVKDMREATMLGEQNVLGLNPVRAATVVALSECTVHVISEEPLRRLLQEFPTESFVFRRLVESGFDKHLEDQSRLSRLHGSAALDHVASEDGGAGKGQTEMRMLDLTRKSLVQPDVGRTCSSGTRSCSSSSSGGSDTDDEDDGDAKAEWDSEGSNADGGIGRRGSERSFSSRSHSDDDDDDDEPEDPDLVKVSWDLALCKDLELCNESFLRKLQAQLRPRLYLAGQCLCRQGEDMCELIVLQKGHCEVAVFGAHLDPLDGPCIIGGSMSFVAPKALTSVTAKETCFVATLPKRQAAAVLDAFPQERRRLLASSNQGFEQLCDSFHQHYVGLAGLERSLAALPFLSGSCSEFLSLLASLLTPHLLLPGQVVLDSSVDHHDSDEETKLYILFGGYCHQISDGVVVGTISQKMVFGEMEVFGVNESRGWHLQVKTTELCEVATVTRAQLFEAFARHPQERFYFEQLVHNRLETTVSAQVIGLSFFAGMPSQFLSKVCVLLDRRLYFQETEVITEGDSGDSMVIVNRGKVELTHQQIQMGLLWAGRCFGVAQMLGIRHDYHATLRTKGTCHLLLLSRKCLHTLAFAGSERPWMTSLRQRAQATLDSELRLFDRRWREHRRAASKAAAEEAAREAAGRAAAAAEAEARAVAVAISASDEASPLPRPVGFVLPPPVPGIGAAAPGTPAKTPAPSRPSSARTVRSITAPARPGSARSVRGLNAQALLQLVWAAWRRSALGGQIPERIPRRRPVTPKTLSAESQELGQPIRFSRGLRPVCLEGGADGVGSADVWRHWAQSGRLDRWKCLPSPRWLVAVREEIPAQILALKSEARGGQAHLPGSL